MRKLLTLPALLLMSVTAFAHIGFSENPVPAVVSEGKDKTSSIRREAGHQDGSLWLLTAKISENYTMQEDTLISIDAGNLKWEQERHVTVRTVIRGEITAVIENQAEDPASEFWFHTDVGEPVSITVSGEGSHNHSSKYTEIIDGKLITATYGDINVSGSALPSASLMFYYTPDSKDVSAGISIRAKGSDKGRMFYDEWKDTGGDIDDYFLTCSAGCNLSGDRSCNITKTPTGYQATWKTSESKQRHTVDGTEFITSEKNLNLTIEPYKPSDKPEVTLYGCSELGIEEQGEIIASGTPQGGSFKFWVEPNDLLKVQSDGGSSVILTGSTPGKGILYVEYTTAEGKTNTTSQPASCVQIENYNNGQEIPQIPLFDIDGKKLSGKLTVPISAQPSNIEELVDFVPADKSVLSAAGLSGAVEVYGSRAGKTTLQAQTNCGNTTGPAVEVEVVNCDKETVETLERMREAAVENLQEAAERLQKVAGSEEFEKARDEIVESTEELAAKTALTVIAAGKTEGAVETAVEIAEAVEAVSEMIGSKNQEEFNERTIIATLKAVGSKAVKTLAGVSGVHEAAKKFGENLGEILYHEEVLKSAMESWDKADKDLKRIDGLMQNCKGDKTEPKKQEEPKGDQTPEPTKPIPPKEPKPRTDTPPAKEQPTEEPVAPEPGDEEPPVSPPPPASEPRQVGLPYSPEECGCEKSKSISISSAGLSDLQAGVKNIGNCVEKFNSISVTDYSNALKELSALTDTLQVVADGNPSLFEVKAKEAKPQLDSLIERTKSYDETGKTFLKQFEKCPESISTGMDVLKSAMTVTVDSIKTNY
jgi:hypothetical protein